MARRTLVAFYSLSGNTGKLAHEIARQLGAEIESIRDATPRRGAIGMLRSIVDASFRREPPIRPPEKKPMDYDLLVLGGPIWAGRLASPVRTYARRHAAGARRIAFFCTQGGRGADRALAELARLCHMSPSAMLVVDARHLASEDHAADLARFTAALGVAQPPSPQAPVAAGQLGTATR
jgi:flavodoxin